MPGVSISPALKTNFVLLSLFALSYATPNSPDCPPADEIVYSPFKPYWFFYPRDRQLCWNFASCVFIEADEARKQQFAAVALVMGLIPLTFHDIAWPERRLLPVSKRQGFFLEMIVRAMGLVPVVMTAKEKAAVPNTSSMVRWARRKSKPVIILMIFITLLCTLVSYAGLALTEIYSKRVSLGCPFPVFVLTWHVAALFPAAIHAGLSRVREHYYTRRALRKEAILAEKKQVHSDDSSTDEPEALVAERKAADAKAAASAVQGAEEWWLVQLCWAIYHIAGTLIFSSVMAVTVGELLAWVVMSFGATWSSKLLAFFLTLAFEKNAWA